MRKIFLSALICLGIMISGFAASETNAPEVIELKPLSAESVPEWAKGSKWCFKVDAGEYICYLNGSAEILGITTKDGKRVMGKSGTWLMQYRIEEKFNNYQEYGSIPKLKVFKADNELSMILPPAQGKLLEWERKIVFQGKTINIDFAFRYTDSFKKLSQEANHISIFTRLSLPDFNQAESSEKKAVFKSEGFAWNISFNPDGKDSAKEWYVNKEDGEIRVNAENFAAKCKQADETFKIKIVLEPL